MKNIRSYKLFLESFLDDILRKNHDNLKTYLHSKLAHIYEEEKNLRLTESLDVITECAEGFMETIIDIMVFQILKNKEFTEEVRDKLINNIITSFNESKNIFIKTSFKKGLDNALDLYLEKCISMKEKPGQHQGDVPGQHQGGTDSQHSTELNKEDYENMSKSEIDSLIRKALDDKDFDKVEQLLKYIRESVESKNFFEFTDELKTAIGQIFDDLNDLISKTYQTM